MILFRLKLIEKDFFSSCAKSYRVNIYAVYINNAFLWILYGQEMVSRHFARRPTESGLEDLDYYILLDSFYNNY